MRAFALLAAACALLAGCTASPPPAEPIVEDPEPAPPQDAAFASFLHGLSEPDGALSLETALLEHLEVPSPDGIQLDTWVARPDVDGPVPLVMTFTPYYAGGAPREAVEFIGHAFGRLGDELVSRGYAIGISSVRGTGMSGGCFTIGGASEAKDTAAVVEELARQPWSNGNVGLIGVSYDGTTPQDVWIEAPPSLKAIVPIAGISDFYKYNFVSGVPISVQGYGFNAYYWAEVGLLPYHFGLLGTDPTQNSPASVPASFLGEACAEQVAVQEGGASSTVDGNKDGYWQERDFAAELAAAPNATRAAVFYIHGLQDWNVKPHNMDGWLEAVQATGVPFKAWLGQWGHNWPQSPTATCAEGQSCRNDWWMLALVAWFDQFLLGVETGILDAPAVQVQDDGMAWRNEDSWPPTDVEWRAFGPQADGTLSGNATGSGSAEYHDGMALGLSTFVPALGPAEVRFVSEELEEDLHIAGIPLFTANVTASGRQASLLLTLAEEANGQLRPFNFAAQSLNHAADLAAGNPDIAGVTQPVTARFFPQDDVVHKGSRLVLIASGDLVFGDEPGPSLQPVATGSTITLGLDGAQLLLPVDGTIAYEDPQPFGALE